jgi:hypothetical protein
MKVAITKAIPGETVDGEAERLTGEKGVEMDKHFLLFVILIMLTVGLIEMGIIYWIQAR